VPYPLDQKSATIPDRNHSIKAAEMGKEKVRVFDRTNADRDVTARRLSKVAMVRFVVRAAQ
jgi:hypothetical protein